jgi:hypothetical protein
VVVLDTAEEAVVADGASIALAFKICLQPRLGFARKMVKETIAAMVEATLSSLKSKTQSE